MIEEDKPPEKPPSIRGESSNSGAGDRRPADIRSDRRFPRQHFSGGIVNRSILLAGLYQHKVVGEVL